MLSSSHTYWAKWLSKDVGASVDKERYQRLVGRLIYLSHTRPDIAFALSVVSQFMHDPRTSHMDVVYRILRYLKSSRGKGLSYTKQGNMQVECYTDADWAGSLDDRRSTFGYCTFVGGNLVAWRSKKAKCCSTVYCWGRVSCYSSWCMWAVVAENSSNRIGII